MANSNPDFLWMIVKNWSAFLIKKRNVSTPFSVERNNLTNRSTLRSNGLIHKKTIDIAPAEKGRLLLSYKTKKNKKKPRKMYHSIELKGGARVQLHALKKFITKNNYRRDLLKPALRRASALLEAHSRTIKMNKARAKKGD